MENKNKKMSKARLRAIIVASISAVCAIALIITNFFIPVKYLSSYMVTRGNRAPAEVMRVKFADVKFGDCAIIELPDGKNLLIDGGDGSNKNEHAVLKLLNRSGIDVIDYLVCTSPKKEHCGGLLDILKYKTVKKVYLPYCTNEYVSKEFSDFVYKVRYDKTDTEYIHYGAGFYNDDCGYFFSFLSPSRIDNPNSEYNDLNKNPTGANVNNASAVCWLEYSGVGFLFTSDAGSTVFEKIIKDYTVASASGGYCKVGKNSVDFSNCKVLQVAGHGSKFSACAPFTDFLAPDYGIISVGQNSSGCPSVDAITNAVNSAGEVLRTDEVGTVVFDVTKNGYSKL